MRKTRAASHGRILASVENCARRAAQSRGLVIRQHGDLGEVAFPHKATRLGFMVAQPYGTIYPFDFIVQGGQNLRRIQIKSVAYVRNGLYYLNVRRSKGRRLLAYINISRRVHRSFVGRLSLCENPRSQDDSGGNTNAAAHVAPPTANDRSYVPSLHPARYSSCSGVSLSILIPMDSSFNFATRLSKSAGTR